MNLHMKYFVLKPRGDDPYALASRIAMQAYADAIKIENPDLCDSLLAWVALENPDTSHDGK